VVCGANIHLEWPVWQLYGRDVNIGGREVFQSTGLVRAAFTNTDNGKSVTVSSTGLGRGPVDVPEAIGSGRVLAIGFPLGYGLPEVFVDSGYFDVTFNEDGSVTINRLTGHVTDVCALLA
jgi:hypothetical protein